MTKVCVKCGVDKPIADYPRDGTLVRSSCKKCRSVDQMARRRAQRKSDAPKCCPRCGETQPTKDFRGAYCKTCTSAYQNSLRQKNPTRRAYARNYYLVKTYGITADEYDVILARQGGGCAICGATRGAVDRESLCVDHNHVTGVVRGLLCLRCNFSVRDLGDDLDLARKTMEYIQAWSEDSVAAEATA